MGNDGKAARRALRSAIESWFWRATLPPPPPAHDPLEDAPPRSIRTELSATLFSGEPNDWVRYLAATESARYERGIGVAVHLDPQLGVHRDQPTFPEFVALKVDRITGKKKKAILEAEEAMQVGRALAGSPHVVRLYDTGKLPGVRFTYHVLQLIDGDTLDNLVGVSAPLAQ